MSEDWFDSKKGIETYLSFQYIPEPEFDIPETIIESSQMPEISGSREKLIKQGQRALLDGFDRYLDDNSDKKVHVVPLSGGVDSRAIFAFLLDNVAPSTIVTYTFGSPGTLDFEIGQKVANKFGIENIPIDMSPDSFPWSEDFLIESANEYTRPTKLFRARESYKYFVDHTEYDDFLFWSGYMGGSVAGSTLPENESKDWESAIDYFIDRNYFHPRLSTEDFEPRDVLPNEPAFERDVMTYDEQLDFGVRQAYYIRPSALPKDGYSSPYLTKTWLDFILNVPRKYRVNKRLFKDIITRTYPDVFSMKTTNYHGLPLTVNPAHAKFRELFIKTKEKIKKNINYCKPWFKTNHLDWDIELKRSRSLKRFARKQLKDLRRRNTVDWINPPSLLTKHRKGEYVGRKIRTLVSLEIFLKAYRDTS